MHTGHMGSLLLGAKDVAHAAEPDSIAAVSVAIWTFFTPFIVSSFLVDPTWFLVMK
jgi:hypothetical protein